MRRLKCILVAAVAFCTSSGCVSGGPATAPSDGQPASAQEQRPNIVLIVLDDAGFSDLGAFGSEIRTPNIDAIASDGLRYNRFDSKAVCTPTRAALLTGRNPQTVRMADLPAAEPTDDVSKDRGELPENAQTVAQVLRGAGYHTVGLGKWHLGPEYEDGSPGNNASWPLQRGFDDFYGFYLGWTHQYRPKLIEGNNTLADTPDDPDYHFSADIANRAIAAMQPGGQPEFLYLAFGAPHAPLHVPQRYIDGYAGMYDRGWDALRVERLARLKDMGIVPADTVLPPRNPGDRAWDSLTPAEKTVFARFMATYAGFIEHTDEQIGRLVAHLKATGQYDNTLIMIISDNGAASEAGQTGTFDRMYRPSTLTPEQMLERLEEFGGPDTMMEYQRPWAMAGVTPFRRYKVWPYLGGVRTPLIISWPRAIRDRGAIRGQYVDMVDLAPTITDVAGAGFPTAIDGRQEIPVAGKSIRQTFISATAPTRTVQYFELRGNRAITSGKWRAVAIHEVGGDFAKDRWELFDTSADFSESTDLAARYPEKLEELKALWWQEARRHGTPALSEMQPRMRTRERFDDSPNRTSAVPPEG